MALVALASVSPNRRALFTSHPHRTEGLYLRLRSPLVHLQRGERFDALISACASGGIGGLCPQCSGEIDGRSHGSSGSVLKGPLAAVSNTVPWRMPLLSERSRSSLVGMGSSPSPSCVFPHTYRVVTSLRSASHGFTATITAEICL